MKAVQIIGRVGVVVLCAWGAWWVLSDPRSPLPDAWHPMTPLDVSADLNWLTPVKLDLAARDPVLCQSVLSAAGQVTAMPPKVASDQCGIDPRLQVSALGAAKLRPVETACATALRLAMWERHALQPAAQRYLGSDVTEILHQGSYNCRQIRTTSGAGARMSTHARALAIDVRGVALADGRKILLLNNYFGTDPASLFYRAVRDGGCDWFKTVLGPEFNTQHADHFHMQAVGWGTCR